MALYYIFSIFLSCFFLNFLLISLYDKKSLDKKVWKKLLTKNIPQFNCIDNVVVTYKNNLYGIDVLYPTINNIEISCTQNQIPDISQGTPLKSCGLNNGYTNKTHFCNIALFNIYSILRN
jgi:hypothetical protein